jgi:hypothetical protein
MVSFPLEGFAMNAIVYIAGLFVLSLVIRALTKKAPKFNAPPRIQLFAATAVGQHAKDLIARKHDLDQCGLKRIGTYRIDPLNVIATAFANPEEHICAVVYHHPMVGCFVDIVCKSTSGRSYTATNAPAGGALDHRDGQEKHYDKTLAIPALFELAKSHKPEGPYDDWTAENFKAKFEQAYADDMDWRARRGGVTKEEVRRQAAADGKQYSEEVIHEATEQLKQKFAESRNNVN